MFGTAALAHRYYSILPDLSHCYYSQVDNSQEILEHLNGHFENLASAATNSHAALEQIAAATT